MKLKILSLSRSSQPSIFPTQEAIRPFTTKPHHLTPSYTSWESIPQPNPLDSAFSDTSKLILTTLVNRHVENIQRRTPQIIALELSDDSGTIHTLLEELNTLFKASLLEENIQRETAFLKKTHQTIQRQDPTWYQKNMPDIVLFSLCLALEGWKQFSVFNRFDKSIPDTWPQTSPKIEETMVFLYFVMFFKTLIQTALPLIAKKLVMGDTYPSIPLTTDKTLIHPQHPLTLETLQGSFDISATHSNQYLNVLPLLNQAQQGILHIPLRLATDEDALDHLLTLISTPQGGLKLGGVPTHTTLPTMMMVFTKSTAPLSSFNIPPHLQAIYTDSHRIQKFTLPQFHNKTKETLNTVLRLLKQAFITSSSPNTPPPPITEDVIKELANLLSVDHFMTTPHRFQAPQSPSQFIVWNNAVKTILLTILKTASITNTPLTPHTLKAQFADLLSDSIRHLIEAQFLKFIQADIPPYHSRSSLTSDTPYPEISIPIDSPHKSQIPPLTTESLNQTEIEFFTKQHLKFHELALLYVTDSPRVSPTSHNDLTKIPAKFTTLFDEIPSPTDPTTQDALKKNPFLLIAGNTAFIRQVLPILNIHCAELVTRNLDPAKGPIVIPKPPIFLLLDDRHSPLSQYGSGKSTLSEAIGNYLMQVYTTLGIQTLAQVLTRENDQVTFSYVPTPTNTPPKGLKETIYSLLKAHPALTLLASASTAQQAVVTASLTQDISAQVSGIDSYNALDFPWTLFIITTALNGVLVYGSQYLDDTFNNSYTTVLKTGNAPITSQQVTPEQLHPDHLLGTHTLTPTHPQKLFKSSKYLGIPELDQHILTIENGQAPNAQTHLESFLRLCTQRSVQMGGGHIERPFAPVAVTITGNSTTQSTPKDPSPLLTLVAPYADAIGTTNILQEWPKNPQDQAILFQKLLMLLKPTRSEKDQIKWTNATIHTLLHTLKITDPTTQKTYLFFGIRHLKTILTTAESLAKSASTPALITPEILIEAFKTQLTQNPHLAHYFPILPPPQKHTIPTTPKKNLFTPPLTMPPQRLPKMHRPTQPQNPTTPNAPSSTNSGLGSITEES